MRIDPSTGSETISSLSLSKRTPMRPRPSHLPAISSSTFRQVQGSASSGTEIRDQAQGTASSGTKGSCFYTRRQVSPGNAGVPPASGVLLHVESAPSAFRSFDTLKAPQAQRTRGAPDTWRFGAARTLLAHSFPSFIPFPLEGEDALHRLTLAKIGAFLFGFLLPQE